MVNSRFTKGIRDAMSGFFKQVDLRLDGANGQIEEINKMMEAMYRKLNTGTWHQPDRHPALLHAALPQGNAAPGGGLRRQSSTPSTPSSPPSSTP
jgi:hypothetical protein